SRASPGSPTSGQPARKTDDSRPRTRLAQMWSARNGITGEMIRSDCTSAYQSVRNACASSRQNRGLERRMYQFERASATAPEARAGEGRLVRLGRVAQGLVRARDEPAVERMLRRGPCFQIAHLGLPAGHVRVLDEEPDRVPQRQQPPLDLVRGAETEPQVAIG